MKKDKQDGNIESVSVVGKAEGTNISRFVLLKALRQHTACVHCVILSKEGKTVFTQHI